MPLFEFDCLDCQQPFEKLVRSASRISEVSCPTCGSAKVQRKLSTFAVKGGTGSSSASSTSAANCAPGGL